ncbi:MAG: hypothetical protein PVH89_06755 [Gammaproteobacteria bacterium]
MVAALWLLAAPVLAPAAEPGCAVPESGVAKSRLFGELQATALALGQAGCMAFAGSGSALDPELGQRYRDFGIQAREVANATFEGMPIERLDEAFAEFVEQLSERRRAASRLPELRVELSGSSGDWLRFHFDDPASAGGIANPDADAACVQRLGISCSSALGDLATAINSYKIAVERLSAARVVSALDDRSSEWEAFVAHGRSQTPLDLLLTTAIERRHLRSGFLVGPPKRQWSALRPGLVLEHAPASAPGDRNDFAVAIEWFGVNWWNEDSPLFGVPFGVSLTSVYSDRPGRPDPGHGLALHFGNKYSVGWSTRDGTDSVFFSIDLLKLVDDRQHRLERYRRRLDRLRGRNIGDSE